MIPTSSKQGLLDTLEELGHEPTRVDALGCGGGNSCSTGVIESVQGMVGDGVDVMFPLLNVINLPAYIGEMVTQGVQPGQIQFYQSGYNAQNGDLVSSKVVAVQRRGRGQGLQRHDDRRGRRHRRVPSARLRAQRVRRDVQPRVPGARAATTYTPTDPETNSAYGATIGMCTFIRTIARAVEAAGPNPTREDLGGRGRGARRDRHGTGDPGQLRARQVHRRRTR